MADSNPSEHAKSWWTTLPGVLTAIAGVLTAVTGLLAVLAQQGVIGGAKDKPVESARAATPIAEPKPSGDTAAKAPAAATPAATTTSKAAGADKAGVDLAALRAEGFKGAVITLTDGSHVRISSGMREYIHGDRLKLDSGQFVDFARLQAFEVLRYSASDSRGEVLMTLLDGKTLQGKTVDGYELRGRNDLGDVNAPLGTVKRVDFVR
jgi:hypothetical protein